ncbi:hypothetical protein CYY_003866 [Polysphondylium violaceum]|uniref:Tubulin-specific chaperone D n=1 Tax=Polysphondylium violaceum TaxID=133409 RepID=A0A8J4PX35_9MYCE|nr:hypothetical protein CYY_003866 [Polysphondylium violaceum]
MESNVDSALPDQEPQTQEQQYTCQKTFVQEADELNGLVQKLVSLNHRSIKEIKSTSFRIIYILELYLEQSNLLDAHLKDLVTPLIDFIKVSIIKQQEEQQEQENDEIYFKSLRDSFKILYVLTKVRGFKTIIKLFPHEVTDLVPVVKRLEVQYQNWIDIKIGREEKNQLSLKSNDMYLPSSNEQEETIDDNSTQESAEIIELDNNNDNTTIDSKTGMVNDNDNRDEITTWEEIYVLGLWISLLVIIPFKFTAIDPIAQTEQGITNRMVRICKQGLSENSKIRESFSELLAKLLIRPDMKKEQKDFLDWCSEAIDRVVVSSQSTDNVPGHQDVLLLVGIYSTLASMFKKGNRIDYLPFPSRLYQKVIEGHRLSSHGSERIMSKIFIKLVQRVAIIMLPPVSGSWRYQKLIKPLLLKNDLSVRQIGNNNAHADEQEEDDVDIPQEIDEILELVLGGLKDKDTIVRWTSAKGIGRIVSLLPKEMGDQVIQVIIDLFEKDETLDADPSAWHGACLALAELSRRGLLLPERLDQVVPLLVRSLFFDILKGTYSVGSHVRDSACYLSWALARTYHHSVLSKYLDSISQSLVVTSLFDREINCRKSASAAFQELVGRHQGSVPHGIDIVTTADFFAVGNRKNSFTNIALFIASYPEYYESIVAHLAKFKVYHWDLEIRELAAKSIKLMTNINPQYIVEKVLPTLISSIRSDLIPVRHGGSITISDILISLQENNQTQLLSSNIKYRILYEIKDTKNEKLYKGKGGALIRLAMCRLIYSICLLEFPLDIDLKQVFESDQQQNSESKNEKSTNQSRIQALRAKISMQKSISNRTSLNNPSLPSQQQSNNSNIPFDILLNYLKENLIHPNEDVQKQASVSFKLFFENYMVQDKRAQLQEMVKYYCKTLISDPNNSARRGSALVLGVLPFKFMNCTENLINNILDSLIKSMFEDSPLLKDIETRVNAIHSIQSIGSFLLDQEYHNKSDSQLSSSFRNQIFIEKLWNPLIKATGDYSIDKRGDIGSWVRELSCKVLYHLVSIINSTIQIDSNQGRELIDQSRLTNLLCILFKLSAEKLDKIRDVVCNIIHKLLWIKPSLENLIIDHQKLINIFVEFPSSHFNWFRTNESFPLLCMILQFDTYRNPFLEGLFSSIGGASKYLVDDSIASILFYFDSSEKDSNEFNQKIINFSNSMIKILEIPNEKYNLSTIKSVFKLIETKRFDYLLNSNPEILERIVYLCKEKIKKLNDIYLLLHSIPLFSYFLIEFKDNKNILDLSNQALLSMVSNTKFPKVRKLASLELCKSKFLSVNSKHLLYSTQWDQDIEVIINQIEQLYLSFNYPIPKHLSASITKEPSTSITTKEPEPIISHKDEQPTTVVNNNLEIVPEDSNDLMEI